MRLVIATVLLSACMEPRINPNDPKWVYNEFGEKWKGDKGDNGRDGIKGDKGERGEKGETGERGEKGEKGEKGDKGDIGLQGITGERGPQGIQGERGFTGPVGPQGIQGVEGPIGPQGEKGDKGDVGECKPHLYRTSIKLNASNVDDVVVRSGGFGGCTINTPPCVASSAFVSIPALTLEAWDKLYVVVQMRIPNTTEWMTSIPLPTFYKVDTQISSCWGPVYRHSYTFNTTNNNGTYLPGSAIIKYVPMEGGILINVTEGNTTTKTVCSPEMNVDLKIAIIE